MKTQKRHILWFILIRLIAVTSILVAVVIIQHSTTDFMPLIPFYYLVLLAYLVSVVYLALYRFGNRYDIQALLQTGFDLLLITALVYISGGLSGSLYLLYIISIIAASIVLSNRAAYLTAGVSAVLFGLLVDGLHFGVIPYFSAEQYREHSLGLIIFTMFLAWGLFFLTAALANYLTASLRKTREELRRAEKELEISERLANAGRISAQLAHEIRNPLAAISGSVQVLRSDRAFDEDQRKLMDIVVRESARVSQSIEQFLDLASPGKLDFHWLNLTEVLDETLALLRAGGELDGQYRIDGNFHDVRVGYYGNAGQFRQLFWNLAKNALKAMPGGGTLTVDLSLDKKKTVRIRLADTGRGLTTEEREHLFEPFFTRFENGRGLGLVIVRRIVDDYDGRIEVRSEAGRGTEFLLTFPPREARAKAAGRPILPS
jgi:two-component system, NtrC family, sensor histidine kinase HydH